MAGKRPKETVSNFFFWWMDVCLFVENGNNNIVWLFPYGYFSYFFEE